MSAQGLAVPPPFSLSATRGRWASEGRKSAKQFPELQDLASECWRTRNVRAPTVHGQSNCGLWGQTRPSRTPQGEGHKVPEKWLQLAANTEARNP